MGAKWDINRIPSLDKTQAIVTGANSGIGFEAAKVLAGKGADVVLAVRSSQKGQQAVASILQTYPDAKVDVMPIDLSDLASVRAFAKAYDQSGRGLSLLINNAGVMATPYQLTKDGFELQFGTNHLGHFALTGLLLPHLLAAPTSRVVSVSSMAHTGGQIDFNNLDGARGYRRWRAYSQSKLANLLFIYELQRRLKNAGRDTVAVACHPGFAATNLSTGMGFGQSAWGRGLTSLANLLAQSAHMGALPTLYAATDERIVGGEYIGPTGFGKMRGYPGPMKSSDRSYDQDVAMSLWTLSEQLTGIHFDAL
jgi:NAD(P)-dependent dehydrogenase (short-subunit alcohol dehydrogenase family)